MNHIRNARVYTAKLPSPEALEQAIAQLPLQRVPETMHGTIGFVPNKETGKFLDVFPGGCMITLGVSEKKISKKALNERVLQICDETEEETGKILSKEEIETIRQDIVDALLKVSLVETKYTRAMYIHDGNYLICNTTGNDADAVIQMLIKACESVQTSTIHVDGVSSGLTARLRNHIDGSSSKVFEGFSFGDFVKLSGETGTAQFDLDNLDHAENGIRDALDNGMDVVEIELVHNDIVSFKLTNKFRLKAIEFLGTVDEEDEQHLDTAGMVTHELAVTATFLRDALDSLCTLFGAQRELFIEEDEDNG